MFFENPCSPKCCPGSFTVPIQAVPPLTAPMTSLIIHVPKIPGCLSGSTSLSLGHCHLGVPKIPQTHHVQVGTHCLLLSNLVVVLCSVFQRMELCTQLLKPGTQMILSALSSPGNPAVPPPHPFFVLLCHSVTATCSDSWFQAQFLGGVLCPPTGFLASSLSLSSLITSLSLLGCFKARCFSPSGWSLHSLP